MGRKTKFWIGFFPQMIIRKVQNIQYIFKPEPEPEVSNLHLSHLGSFPRRTTSYHCCLTLACQLGPFNAPFGDHVDFLQENTVTLNLYAKLMSWQWWHCTAECFWRNLTVVFCTGSLLCQCRSFDVFGWLTTRTREIMPSKVVVVNVVMLTQISRAFL